MNDLTLGAWISNFWAGSCWGRWDETEIDMTAFAQQSCLISISFRLFFLFLQQSDLLRAFLPFDTVYIYICLCLFHFIPIFNVFRFNSAATDRAFWYGWLYLYSLFSLCLFTTSSTCTMFTGVVLICGFSLSLSVSLSPSFFIYDSIRIDAYSKDLPGGWKPFASSQAVFREHFLLHQTLPGLWRQQHLRLSIMGSGRRWQSWNSYVLCQTWTCKQLWGNGIGM